MKRKTKEQTGAPGGIDAGMKRIRPFLACSIFLILVVGSSAFASEGGEHHSAASFGMPMVYAIINFVLLIIAFVYLYKKKGGSGSFEKRSLGVQQEMEVAAEAKRQAQAKYEEYQRRLADLDKEIAKILEVAKAGAETDRRALIAEAHKQTEKMLRQAELTAGHEVEEAKRQIRREAADLAAETAAAIVRRAARPEDQRAWVQTSIEKMGDMQNRGTGV